MFFAPVVRTRAVAPGSRSFDRSFERFVNEAFFSPSTQRVNVQQDEKAWTVTLDLPGVTREELSIATEGNVVRIETKAEAKADKKAAKAEMKAEKKEAKAEKKEAKAEAKADAASAKK